MVKMYSRGGLMLSEQSFKLIRRDRRLVLVEVESQRSFRTFIPSGKFLTEIYVTAKATEKYVMSESLENRLLILQVQKIQS